MLVGRNQTVLAGWLLAYVGYGTALDLQSAHNLVLAL